MQQVTSESKSRTQTTHALPGSSCSPVILATLFLQQGTGLILMTQAQNGRTPVDCQVQGTEAWLVSNQT
jgi:hypothetical protein